MKHLLWLFAPFALLIHGVLTIRHLLFDTGIWKQSIPKSPSIGIGNLSVGGTGKTPLVIYLAQQFQKKDTTVISRGYGRKSKGFLEVENPGSALQFGDEPIEIKQSTSARVVVCESRVAALQRIPTTPNSLLIFDDVWQHRHVQPKVKILTSTFQNPFFNDLLFPLGSLRDLKKRSQVANIILITKSPKNIPEKSRQAFHKNISYQPFFFTHLKYAFTWANTDQNASLSTTVQHLVLTGIAQPKPLYDELDLRAIQFQEARFADHHNFSTAEIGSILSKFTKFAKPESCILTTQKDWVRLETAHRDQILACTQVCIVTIQIGFENTAKEKEFLEIINVAL
ncbi:MAG: tetraacyldisaccharide 4'-kinase [Luteibaculaceae bacterium]|jgi:tetraacyldisaccharide 4'-kinase